MPASPIRVGIIGTGGIAHAPAEQRGKRGFGMCGRLRAYNVGAAPVPRHDSGDQPALDPRRLH